MAFQFDHPGSIDLSIIIVSFNTQEILCQCIESVYRHTQNISFEIFVVDNASVDGSAGAVEEKFPEVTLICNSENRGFSAANNQAIARSHGRYIALLNPDTLLFDNSFLKITDYLNAQPQFSILGPKLIDENDRRYPVGLWQDTPGQAIRKILGIYSKTDELDSLEIDESKEVEVISGACFMVRRAAFEKVGLLEEGYFLYNEENDFCRRARAQGMQICFFPEAAVKHLLGKSTQQPEHREKVIIETYKSNLRFYGKYYSLTWNVILRGAYCTTFILGIVRSFFKQLLGKGTQSADDSIALKIRLLMMKIPK